MNTLATAIFALAILHTFLAGAIASAARGRRWMHLLGEVEIVFALWTIPLVAAMTTLQGWDATLRYLTGDVSYIEPLFVIVIMAIASSRPIIALAEAVLRRLAALGGGTPAAWWLTILIVGPLLGSFLTEPAAMTVSALLLERQFFVCAPGMRLRYATLGLLFVSVSIGGTLTPFAAPPVLMVARPWGWDMTTMLTEFGWRVMLAVPAATLAYFAIFARQLRALRSPAGERPEVPPAWLALIHAALLVWVVVNAHEPANFLTGFAGFLIVAAMTVSHQRALNLRTPLMVGLFLAGLVVHGGLQGWWIRPLLERLGEEPLFAAATILTAFNDNALITYLATLVPDLNHELRVAVVQGAVAGGGLTVIANAPNPAGQALLGRFFEGGVHPLRLLAAAALPTVFAIVAFRLL